MSTITLLSSTMPDLLPMLDRSPGIHLTDITTDLAIKMGHFKPSPLNMARLQLGNALEWAIIERMLRHDPKRYVRIGERELDGIYITGDIFDKRLWVPNEIKLTWQSLKSRPDEVESATGFWMRRAQVCAQAKVMRADRGVIPIVHIMGDYKKQREPAYREWEERWSKQEVDNNWDNLQRHRDEMIQTSERWRRIAMGEDRAKIDLEENEL